MHIACETVMLEFNQFLLSTRTSLQNLSVCSERISYKCKPIFQRWSSDTVLRNRDETRLWGSETETRHETLQILFWFKPELLSQSRKSESHVFGWSRNRSSFLNTLKPESLFLMCRSWYRILIFL